MGYLETTQNIYTKAAATPDVGLCCTTSPAWAFPGLKIPGKMLDMDYGCGSTVNPRDLVNNPKILYVGVGGGMELLQFAYFSREKGNVIGVDVVDKMLESCAKNLAVAARQNDWFKNEYIELRRGDALNLPVEDNTIDLTAQNCLFNIFKEHDLKKALAEMYRVLKPHGRMVLSDPICDDTIPDHLREDEQLRGLCLSGALPLKDYLKLISDTGFGTIEIRARRPYRILDTKHYDTDHNIYIESVEICAIKDPVKPDGPCVFTGKSAIYIGDDEYFDDGDGHIMFYNKPLAVCDKTAGHLAALNRDDIVITPSTWFYDGSGCC